MKLDYKIAEIPDYISDIETYLNTLGLDGWELQGIQNNQAYLISGSSGITFSLTGSAIPVGTVSSSTQIENYGRFATTGSNTYRGNQLVYGNSILSGSTDVTGSLSVNGSVNITSGSGFYRNGNKLFNTAQYYCMHIQSGSANTAYPMRFHDTAFETGISIVNNASGDPTRITVSNSGVYNLMFSAQLGNTANTNITFDIWFAITGSNVPYSNTQVDVNKSAGQVGRAVAAWNFATPLMSGSYIEIMWSCNATTGEIHAQDEAINPVRPAIPAVIATLDQLY